MIQEAIRKIVAGSDLSKEEAAAVMNEMMEGEATQSQIASFLTALAIKGETVDEITGLVSVMRNKAARIKLDVPNCVDTCGTGGDFSHTFNISTCSAFVVAGAGIPVAKHGNRSATSSCGSADVLEKLGAVVNLTPDIVKKCIEQTGIGFMFAPNFHLSMKNVAAPRKEIGIRTVFNILGPLTNPAGAPFQLLGVFNLAYAEKMAHVLSALGTNRAFVVHGSDGLDEITLSGKTDVFVVEGGSVKRTSVSPEEFGFESVSSSELKGGSPDRNAEIIKEILSGLKGHYRNIVLMNAAAAIYTARKAESLKEGLFLAAESIDSGKAFSKLENFIKFTNTI
ncbi:MAG: anthranilate phosphoribosyltransferase [Fibrobacteres bacterium]|nr:anthranilate phosphoribosyltransferase [Fibrobacterota bacterium]